MKQNEFCNNCGKNGHSYTQCKSPITSIGIIVYRKHPSKGIQYLMIRRKDSLGYVELIRGKYMLNDKYYIMNILNEMSISELNKIKTLSFNELWNDLWGNNISYQYKLEEKISREKYENLKKGIIINKNTENTTEQDNDNDNNDDNENYYSLDTLLKQVKTKWKETEWGFPKGRRMYQEKDINCALREFQEETGYDKSYVNIIQNIIPYDEIFIGSNYKSYKHKYFVGYIDYDNVKNMNNLNYEKREVSKVSWMNLDECLNSIRPYELERIKILKNIDNILNNHKICK